jgi:hypothetical protein
MGTFRNAFYACDYRKAKEIHLGIFEISGYLRA